MYLSWLKKKCWLTSSKKRTPPPKKDENRNKPKQKPTKTNQKTTKRRLTLILIPSLFFSTFFFSFFARFEIHRSYQIFQICRQSLLSLIGNSNSDSILLLSPLARWVARERTWQSARRTRCRRLLVLLLNFSFWVGRSINHPIILVLVISTPILSRGRWRAC